MNKMDEKLFEFADEDKKKSLNQFMEKNDRKSFVQGIHQITYYDAGDSDTLIILLPGSTGNSIVFFNYIDSLSQSARVVAPCYDIGKNLEEQAKGFIALAESIPHKKLVLFGYSFGGVIAQIMVKIKADIVDDLILFESETKTKHINPGLVKRFNKSYKRLNRSLSYLPPKWMYKSLSKKIAFNVVVGLEEYKHFWEGLYKQVLNETSREEMRLLYSNVREFWKSYVLDVEDFKAYKGRVLILNVEGSVQRVEVQELSYLFEQAEVKVYDESFRMALVTCYNNVVSDLTNFANI